MSEQIEIKFNDYYYDLVPRPTTEEWHALEHSIKLNGVREPIVINEDGVILDGYTRYEICQNLGITPPYRIHKFDTKDDELKYVLETNATRRQLNAYQRVELFYDIFKVMRKEAKENHAKSNCGEKDHPVGGSLIRYSELVGVGQKRCHAAIKIIESDDDELKQRCTKGYITVNMAYSILQGKVKRHEFNKDYKYPSIKQLRKFFNGSPILKELDRILDIYKEENT